MKENINTILLAGILLALVVLAWKPGLRVGRFQPYPQSTAGVLLDTATGKLCAPHPGGFEGIQLCSDLASE